ncbi:L-rhamnose mutarotase [Streptomyces sp. NBC_00448]|uniref:L-rhamnose mutarotase n=1 Tax=Streptomyces sp. NBC_00448 TaxID=2903652 RepID=UPI002E1F6864
MRNPDTEPAGKAVHVTGRRTRLRPGMEARYASVHAAVPPAVLRALRTCGVVRWQIWRDGRGLFHLIESEDRYEVMVERILGLGPIDPEWDRIIAALLEEGEGSDELLPLIWTMVGSEQFAGAAGETLAAPASWQGR